MRLLDLIKVQCFKSASQLCMLDLVFEMMITGCTPNYMDMYENIKLDVMTNTLKKVLLLTHYETLTIGYCIIAPGLTLFVSYPPS